MSDLLTLEKFIFEISQIITATGVIVGMVLAIEKWSKGKISSWLLGSIHTSINEIKKELKETRQDVRKVIIVSEEMPLEERLRAGEKYVAEGGNSAVKIHFKELQRQYEKSLRKEEEK